MSRTETAGGEAGELTDVQLIVLDAVRKGFNRVLEVLDFGGPRFEREGRGLDCPAYLREIDDLIREGYLERAGERFNAQLVLHLTEKGQDAAPTLSDAEREALKEYGVGFDSLGILNAVADHLEREGSRPTISQLQDEYQPLAAFQYSLHFTHLVEAGLASDHGLFRYTIEPTDLGRGALNAYADQL